MNVLFIAFEFPPLGGGGVQRSMKFSKYLPEYGVHPVVVTTDLASYKVTMKNPIDEGLLNELSNDVPVERIPCTLPVGAREIPTSWYRIYFSLVDPQAKYWKPRLEKYLKYLLDVYKPQAIYVSIPPFSMGPLWCGLAKKYKLPLVLDFRDAWSQWRVGPYGSWIHYYLTLRLEHKCLREAEKVICSTEQIREDLLKIHHDIPPQKLITITNGYDVDVKEWSLSTKHSGEGKFTIGYVGEFYYYPSAREAMLLPWWRKKPNRMIQYAPRKEDWLYRSPYFFFKAIKTLLGKRPELKEKLKIRFAGRKPTWIDGQVSELGLTDVVEFVGYLNHDDVLKFQSECDCLLVTSSKVHGGPDYSIAGKTFEYFSLKKPVLGFVTEGAQKEMLKQSGVSILCDPDNTDDASVVLSDLIDGKIALLPNVDFLNGLHRRRLTKSLANVFLNLNKN